MITIHSFDVFDTCLIRKVAAPSHVFYEVAKKVFTKLGIPISRPFVEDFVATRIQSEQAARQQSGREDIALHEIWQKLVQSMGWQYDDSLAQLELDTEEELYAPVSSIRKQVQAARQQGCRVIFVSDMYLPKEFITRQLVKHGFAEEGDGFYVSGEIGKTKASGNLYRYLLAQENVLGSNIWHTGDNQYSDYTVPRTLGIRAGLFTKAQLTQAEIDLFPNSQDSHVATRIVGAMRAFRLGCESEHKPDICELVSQFVAPFLMGFARWVLQRAQEDGVKRLYFVSRDCQLAWGVARELAPQFGGIDCRYLYVSRQALFLPGANAISPEEMPWMRRFFEEPTLDRLLAKLELTFSDVEFTFKELAGNEGGAYRLKSTEDWEVFWRGLNKEPIRTDLMKRIATRREGANGYFESVGLFDDVPWAVVDLGWHLTCQQSLWKLLRQAKWPGQISGYYAELSQQRIHRSNAGKAEALFYQNVADHPLKTITPLSSATLLEHVIGCADHSTVHHYEKIDGKMQPAFAKTEAQATLEFCRNVHDAMFKFVEQNKPLAVEFSDTAMCRNVLESVLMSFVRFPTAEVAGSLRELSAACDQNNLDALPIVKPLNVLGALLPLLPRRKPFHNLWKCRESIWPEGSAAITPTGIRRLAGAAQRIANWRSRVRRVFLNH